MSLYISSLNSGSNGNCYYIGNETEAILIDAGISCSEVEKRMQRLGLNIRNLKAIFISHEHTDHISGVQVLCKKYQLPVYITGPTMQAGRLSLDKHLVRSFSANNSISLGKLSITPFPKFHDAADPFSFMVGCNDINVGVFTDIGVACKNVSDHFHHCHAAFLECNYDDTMLDRGSYPWFLKNRIRGDRGHLSNKEALHLFVTHKAVFMSHLVLSHLSKNNNCPELVKQLFNNNAYGVQMIVASRYEETPLYHICGTPLPLQHIMNSSQLSFAF